MATVETIECKRELEENQKRIRKMVMDSLEDVKAGKGRDFTEFFEELEKDIKMYKYSIIMEPLAEQDIIRNTEYIAYDKKSPEIALKLARGFRKQIASLKTYPQRHEYDEDEELSVRHIRKHYFKNYKIYYVVDEKEYKVYILRVLHMLVDGRALLVRMLKD